MAGSLIHVDERLHSWESAYADTSSSSSNIYFGDFVTRQGTNACHLTDPASDSSFAGIVPRVDRGDALPKDPYDYSDAQYSGDGSNTSDRVHFAPMEELSSVLGWSPHDSASPAPSIARNDRVGIIVMDGSAYGSGRPVLVQEGYTADPNGDGTNTTYNASNSNWIHVGRADVVGTVSGYDELVEVSIDQE